MNIPGDLELKHLEFMLESQAQSNTFNDPLWFKKPFQPTRSLMLIGTLFKDIVTLWDSESRSYDYGPTVVCAGNQIIGLWQEALALVLHGASQQNVSNEDLAYRLLLNQDTQPGDSHEYLIDSLHSIASAMLAQKADLLSLSYVTRVFRLTSLPLYQTFMATHVLNQFRKNKRTAVKTSYKPYEPTIGWDDTHVVFNAARELYSDTLDGRTYTVKMTEALESAYQLKDLPLSATHSTTLN